MEIKIEKGVPVKTGNKKRESEFLILFKQMDFGDSFVADVSCRTKLNSAKQRYNWSLELSDHMTYLTERIDGTNNVRVWKVKRNR